MYIKPFLNKVNSLYRICVPVVTIVFGGGSPTAHQRMTAMMLGLLSERVGPLCVNSSSPFT